jgi:ElaA protein
MLTWQWTPFSGLSLDDLYALMVVRQEVFVVEQKCPFVDADGLDSQAWHLLGRINGRVVAYARLLLPGAKYTEPSIGRVLTTPATRRQGLGRELMRVAIERTESLFPGWPIKIQAQCYLEEFYKGFGFITVSDIFLEDNIEHVYMIRPGAQA